MKVWWVNIKCKKRMRMRRQWKNGKSDNDNSVSVKKYEKKERIKAYLTVVIIQKYLASNLCCNHLFSLRQDEEADEDDGDDDEERGVKHQLYQWKKQKVSSEWKRHKFNNDKVKTLLQYFSLLIVFCCSTLFIFSF